MAFDGITLRKIVSELNVLVNGKVNQIHIKSKDNLVFSIYNNSLYSLNIDTSASNYRINLTTNIKANPLVAPNFCMLLRKYLINSKISKIYVKGLERICYIDFECFNEMNDKVIRTLVIELMGKYSNVTLLNESGTIIDALKKYDGENLSRTIMPARKYTAPAAEKKDFFCLSKEDFTCLLLDSEYKNLNEAIPNMLTGISKQFINSALDTLNISNIVCKQSLNLLYDYISSVLDQDCKFCYIADYKDNYSAFLSNEESKSLQSNFFIDDFYSKRLEAEEYTAYRNSLLKVLSGTLDKILRKLENIDEKILKAKDLDKYKTYGELLLSNIYKFTNNFKEAQENPNLILITEDTKFVDLENFYDNNSIVRIEIDPSLTISKNAEKYFKKYNKAKNTIEITNLQKIETKKELNYIESLVYSLDNCKTIQDLDEVYNEISENILFNNLNLKSKSNHTKNKNNDQALNNYLKYKIDDFDVFIGKNNKQNDYLTLKVARPNDLWFHTKDVHGSHLILRSNGITPKIETITKCAELAAYYSKAKFSSHVPVDYTLIKNIKKAKGTPPGFVIYTNNKTIFVNPNSQINT